MWSCALCGRQFSRDNQVHSCGDKVVSDFLSNKPEHTKSLFWHFADHYTKLSKVSISATKSMIVFENGKKLAFVIRVGKNFVDIVFPFSEPYSDNLCFHKIAQVPGTSQFNHHFRMYQIEDVNEEVQYFMKLTLD